jgi:hypothetical protein
VSVGVFQRRKELFPSPRHCSLCNTPMETPMDSNCQCIPEARGTVPHPRQCSMCSTLLETPTVSNCRCIPEARGIVPLFQTLFTVQYTDGNTDGLKLLVYCRGEGNCSPPPDTVHCAVHR